MSDDKLYSELFQEELTDAEYKQRVNEMLNKCLDSIATTRLSPPDKDPRLKMEKPKDMRRAFKGEDDEEA